MEAELERRTISTEEYHKMWEVGILGEEERVELIQGEIVNMSPIGSKHAACVKRINALFSSMIGDKAIIGIQDPVSLDDYSEPQPDISILKPSEDFYKDRHPYAEDTLLLIEVADTTVESDTHIKIPLYARAGIPECWVIDLNLGDIIIYQYPLSGVYRSRTIVKNNEEITLSLLGHTINTRDILG